jgi:aminopeptidase N
MLRFIPVLIALIVKFTTAQAQGVVPDALLCAEKQNLENRLHFRVNPNIYHGYNIHYHKLNFRINPKRNGYLKGSVFSYFTLEKDADSIGFDMKFFLQTDSVLHRGSKIRFTRASDVLFVHKPGGWKAGTSDSITIFYQGNPALYGGTGYYVYDFHATGPSVHTLSQPYGAYYWWPCKQTLSDKIDSLDMVVSTHSDFRVAGNGLLVLDQKMDDTTRIFHWKHRYPIATYLVATAITNYEEFNQYATFHNRTDSLLVQNYVFPQSKTDLMRDAAPILPMLRLFDSLFGEYPFVREKYGHAQFTWGGGMEHQTMSFMVNFSFDLMAHELAHMWFGDKVTCGSWRDLWLNEGFATYLTALSYRYLKPRTEYLRIMREIRDAVTGVDDGSIFPKDTAQVNRLFSGRLTYNKAAFVLHMLKVKVGDSAFYGACRKFLTGPRAYGFATTQDLQTLMEQESGQNLDTFFMRWYMGEGFPYLNINWIQKGPSMQVTVKQRPSHPSVPFFQIPVPILFQGNNRDTLITLNPNKLEQTFSFSLPFAADTAQFDPNVDVLAKTSLGGMNQDNSIKDWVVIKGNPVTTRYLELATLNLKIEKMEIFNINGQKCMETGADFLHIPGKIAKFDISHLSAGPYVTKITGNNQQTALTFLKL